eukprot:5190228-Prymnesium_polylepis.3
MCSEQNLILHQQSYVLNQLPPAYKTHHSLLPYICCCARTVPAAHTVLARAAAAVRPWTGVRMLGFMLAPCPDRCRVVQPHSDRGFRPWLQP